jgi:transposase
MVMTARALDAPQPHPSTVAWLVRVADGVAFVEDDDGSGAVFLWGAAAWWWTAGDRAARRLAAVQLVETRAARQRQVAAAFGVNEDSLILWRGEYAAHGATALAGRRPGPKGPSKLTEEKRVEIGALRAEGLTLTGIAQRAGVSIDSVRRALARPMADESAGGPPPRHGPVDDSAAGLVPPAGPNPESPVVPTGRSVPLSGALVSLPALAETGLLDAMARVYDRGSAGHRGLRPLLLALVFGCVLGDPRTGGSPLDPAAIGRLVGLDRPLGSETIRRRLRELAALGRAAALIESLARRRLDARLAVDGVLHGAGIERAYRGAVELGATELARLRLSVGTDAHARALDRRGDGILVWSAPPDPPGVDGLRAVTRRVRDLVGGEARPTVCFDRGGWSPKLFAELTAAGFEVMTYGKGRAPVEPCAVFQGRRFIDRCGRVHDYLLAERDVGIEYDGGRRRFPCRRVTSLEPRTGHQTQILTSRADVDAAAIAHATFHRWGQPKLVEHMRAGRCHGALDAPLRVEGPDEAGIATECDRLQDVVRMATYNAVSALVSRLAGEHGDDAVRLLGEAFRARGDVRTVGDELHVRLEPPSGPRRALAALCADLTATRTPYPGTDLRLVYSLGDGRDAWD